jgi:excisionase family DNA binding protein
MARTRETTTSAASLASTPQRLHPVRVPRNPGIEPALPAVAARTTNGSGYSSASRFAGEATLLTFKEAMDFLRVSRSTVYRLMWSGQLRGHKVGSTWRFYRSDLLEAVASPVSEPPLKRSAHAAEGQE